MLKRLRDLFRPRKRELSPESLATLDEAERIRQQKTSLWVGRHEGPPSFTGDEERRRGT
jgi:hypothetical protein